MTHIFIVHGWGGYPEEAWFPWLKIKLEKLGHAVEILPMPNPDAPVIDGWVSFLSQKIGTPDRDTYLVGHSIGVQTILRYLETLDTPIGGVVTVGGWLSLKPTALDNEEDIQTAQPWLTTPIVFDKVRTSASQIAAIFSDDDKYVPIENADIFRDRLGARIIMLSGKGHMGGEDGIMELPETLEEIKKMIGK
ncbi:MAG: alpha/beta hydrolase [Patescibacteria group bacterium]